MDVWSKGKLSLFFAISYNKIIIVYKKIYLNNNNSQFTNILKHFEGDINKLRINKLKNHRLLTFSLVILAKDSILLITYKLLRLKG